jgi:hypothetical protein
MLFFDIYRYTCDVIYFLYSHVLYVMFFDVYFCSCGMLVMFYDVFTMFT